jgi:hypothetical protein
MKKLEDIPKKNVFTAPDGYFDRLPGVIQARASENKNQSFRFPILRLSLRYALPVLIASAGAFYYLSRPRAMSAQDLIASVDSASLVFYLDDGDLSTDDLLESIPLDLDEADAIRNQTIEEVNVEESDVEYLNDQLGPDY